MLHIDILAKKSYYTYTSKPENKNVILLPRPVIKKKKIIEEADHIIDRLEDCILSIKCPVTMMVAYTLNAKLFRKMIMTDLVL